MIAFGFVRVLASIVAALLAGVGLVAATPRAAAQSGASLQELAIDWVRGSFGSPLLCQIDGEPVRGMRRLNVTPGSRHARVPEARIIFVGMEVENATRCFTDLAKSVPDITGSLRMRFPGAERRDSSVRDFKAILRREGGVEFEIASGVLHLREIAGGENRDLDFRGGKARFLSLRPGSDVERVLSSVKSPRKLDLILSTRDGATLELPLFLTDVR
jgi:hypothetical protein